MMDTRGRMVEDDGYIEGIIAHVPGSGWVLKYAPLDSNVLQSCSIDFCPFCGARITGLSEHKC